MHEKHLQFGFSPRSQNDKFSRFIKTTKQSITSVCSVFMAQKHEQMTVPCTRKPYIHVQQIAPKQQKKTKQNWDRKQEEK